MLRACPPSALNADRFQGVWQPLLAILGLLKELPYVIHLGTRAKLTKMCAPPFHPPDSSPLPLAFFFSLWYFHLLWKLPFRWSNDDSFLPHKFPSLTSYVFCPGHVIPTVRSLIVLGNPWVNCWLSKQSNIRISVTYFPLGKCSAGPNPSQLYHIWILFYKLTLMKHLRNSLTDNEILAINVLLTLWVLTIWGDSFRKYTHTCTFIHSSHRMWWNSPLALLKLLGCLIIK